jgi:hypothetical protein
MDSCAKFAKEESLTLGKKFDVIYNEIFPQHELHQQTIPNPPSPIDLKASTAGT